jgi:diguanylate cyclase (GGDEF)-like protein
MFIDLLNFKGINDLWGGHARWDDILNKFGILLRETLRIEDEAGRLWWDEYGVRFSGSGAVHAVDFIARLKEKLVIFNQSLRESFNTDEINIGVSYWVMEFKKGSIPPAVILEFAEKLMYINKGVVKWEAALLRWDFGLAIDISDDPNAGKRQYMLAQSNFWELMELKKEYPEAIWSKEGEDDIQLLHSGISTAHMWLEIKKMYELGEYALASEKIKKLLEIRPNLNMILSSLFPKSFI